MNGKTGVSRSLRRAGVMAVAAAITVLAAGCGVVHVNFGNPSSAPAGSISSAQLLALAQCMRGHGEPDFPDPSASGGFSASVLSMLDSSQAQAAYGACRHLLTGGGPSLAQLQQKEQQVQQELQKQLPVLLKFSQCMRSRGVPDYPDPSLSGQNISGNLEGSGINPSTPQFQAAWSACQHVAPGLHMSIQASSHRS